MNSFIYYNDYIKNINNKPTPQLKCIRDLHRLFPTEQHCINYLEKLLWDNKPISPFDSNSIVYKCANNRYKCKNTGKYFNIKTRTIFENSKISLVDWFIAFYLYSSHKKAISSCQLTKYIDINQTSAWFVLHRLRSISDCSIFETMLKDFVQIDETLIGGKNKNRHWDKKVANSQGRSAVDKTLVLGMLEKNGNLIAQIVPDAEKRTLEPIIKDNIKKGSTVYTDELTSYNDLSKWFKHQRIIHKIKQYARGDVTTNAIENVWGNFKRAYNTYHWISKKHLPKYIKEFTLRHNTRNYITKDKFDLMLMSSVGKRLTYKNLTS